MTVSSATNKVQYNGNGSTTVFAYTFKIFSQNDLTVIVRSATGTETVKTITTHYTVSGVGSAGGGNVTMLTAPIAGETLTILREQDLTQELDLVENDPFPAQSLEDSLDKLTFMVQQHSEEIDRSIKASRTNTITSTEFTVSAASRANKIFAFDSSGELSVTQELGTYRGDWSAATSYFVRDLVKDTLSGNIFIAITAHTSSGTQPITANVDSAKWALLVDNTGSALGLSSSSGSSLVGYNQGGTGATTRTVQARLRDYVSVEDFGAVGDGIADDTAAFNLAIAAGSGEIVLDPKKTYAVNLVITKRGTRINGRSGDNLSVSPSASSVKNLIPYDPTKPVIQIGNDTSRVGGCVIENLSIWSASPSATHGQIGLYLAGGSYGNYVRNVQIGNSFSVHNLKIAGGTSYPNAYNQFYGLQLWTLAGVSQTATLGCYFGSQYCTANYFSGINITGPSGAGTGYAILLDSVQLYMNNAWVQAESDKGLCLSDNYSNFPSLMGDNVAFDSGSSSDVLVTSTIASDTAVLPLNFLKGRITVDGKYKNAAATSTSISYGQFIPNQSISTYPIIYGGASLFNPTSLNTFSVLSASSASDNVQIGDSTYAGKLTLVSGATGSGIYFAPFGTTCAIMQSTYFRPSNDNAVALGGASNRWSVVYAATGTINTSDERQKQDIADLDDAEKRVAVRLKSLVKKFRFKDAVKEKDDAARIHVGVIAQEVVAAFTAEGLDANRYGLLCYDSWSAKEADIDEDGKEVEPRLEAGDRYGVRYEELLAFIIAAL